MKFASTEILIPMNSVPMEIDSNETLIPVKKMLSVYKGCATVGFPSTMPSQQIA